MVQHQATAGVLFADIADSSRLYREWGDERARRTVIHCLNVVSGAVETCGGRVVDRIGDELMCVFDAPGATAQACILLQRAVDEARNAGDLSEHVRVRVGFHCGPVLLDGDQVFGDTVYVARRMATLAKGHQIVTTRLSLQLLPIEMQLPTRVLGHTRLKGKTGVYEVLEIVWDRALATLELTLDPVPLEPTQDRLVLSLDSGEEHTVDQSNPALTIGRDKYCDLVVPAVGVSRLHARIELHKSGFVLIDVSTNGTLVANAGGAIIRVWRDEMRLDGSGTLWLAPREGGVEGSPMLQFRVAAAD